MLLKKILDEYFIIFSIWNSFALQPLEVFRTTR